VATKKQSNEPNIEELQNRINELEKSSNNYDEVFSTFVQGFVMEQIGNNIKTIEIKTLQTWFSNPDDYMEQISNLLTYYYITDGDIFQLYDLIFSLPKLDYSITPYEITKTYEKDMIKIRQVLDKKVKYKRLTRDLLVQEAHDGTVIGTWLGTSTDPYFQVFDNLNYIFPYGSNRSTMRAVFDLSYLDTLQEAERNALYENLKPLITQRKYEKWKNTKDLDKKKELQYVVLPSDKTLVARTHTLYRNQRLGVPHGTASLFDINHKQKMKELERSIADKVIRAVAVLKFKGKDDNENKVSSTAKQKVFAEVKKALEKSTKTNNGTMSLIGIPDFADFKPSTFGEGIDNALNPEKYENANRDTSVGIGINDVLVGGTNGNYASAKLNLEIIYQKIGVMLEDIEEIFNQLIVIILGEKKGLNYNFKFIKDMPISRKERIDYLMKLQAQGQNIKYILDELGIDSYSYINQSIYEIETLKLREKIYPSQSVYTTSGSDNKGGAPTNNNPTNESTIQSTESGANDNPNANI
jgi:hypothetical protein